MQQGGGSYHRRCFLILLTNPDRRVMQDVIDVSTGFATDALHRAKVTGSPFRILATSSSTGSYHGMCNFEDRSRCTRKAEKSSILILMTLRYPTSSQTKLLVARPVSHAAKQAYISFIMICYSVCNIFICMLKPIHNPRQIIIISLDC